MRDVVNESILALGHSHLAALRRGYNRCQRSSQPPFSFSFMRLNDEMFQPNTAFADGVEKLNEAIPSAFEALLTRDNPDVVVSCIRGNEANCIGLLNHPQRFDFYLPSRPDLPTDETAEILPVDLVGDLILHRLRHLQLYLSALAPLSGGRLIHLQSPPPIGDNAYIASYPSQFGEKAKKFGVSPKFFRLKLWLLTGEVLAQLCRDVGVILHPAPQPVRDAEGFLAKKFWNEDPNHGNAQYGKVILQNIARTNFRLLVREKASERSPLREPAESLLLATSS
jgi:hypothetical protein